MLNYATHLRLLHGAHIALFVCVRYPGEEKAEELNVQELKKRFGAEVVRFDTWTTDGLEEAVIRNNVTHLYQHKAGGADASNTLMLSKVAKNCVNLMFDARKPVGDAVARISSAVRVNRAHCVPVMPLMIAPGQPRGSNLRARLGIPPNATVFGRYGGQETFNIKCVQREVCKLAEMPERPDLYFIFANTAPFCAGRRPRRIIHLGHLPTEKNRSLFIRTSDAMLHARRAGETFGNSVGEFSTHNRPVFTARTGAVAHIDILGRRAQIYGCNNLSEMLLNFRRNAARQQDWNAYRDYYPVPIMHRFISIYGC